MEKKSARKFHRVFLLAPGGDKNWNVHIMNDSLYIASDSTAVDLSEPKQKPLALNPQQAVDLVRQQANVDPDTAAKALAARNGDTEAAVAYIQVLRQQGQL